MHKCNKIKVHKVLHIWDIFCTFVVEKRNMLNVNQSTMIKMTLATEKETQRVVLELLKIESLKFQVIGRRQIIIFE